ncbi:hypothetical protein FOZ63_004593, partial [Perkinsus olseni]
VRPVEDAHPVRSWSEKVQRCYQYHSHDGTWEGHLVCQHRLCAVRHPLGRIFEGYALEGLGQGDEGAHVTRQGSRCE